MKKKITITIIFLILLISYLYLGNKLNVYINCPIKEITGLYCPGCGITRMLQAILQLNFYQAFRHNPLLFISLPFFIFFTVEGIITKKDPLYNKIPNKILITIIIIFIIYGILRNLPLFDFLAPTIVR